MIRTIAALSLLALAAPAWADDASSGDCKHPSCTCVDAEAAHDCLDADGCEKFCADHDGVAKSVHSGYNLPVKKAEKKKKKTSK